VSKEYEIAFKLEASLESTFARTFAAASNDMKDLQKKVTELSKGKGMADTTRPVRDDLRQTRAAMQNTESVAGKMMGTIQRAGTALAGVFAVRKIYGAGSDLVQTYAGFEQGLANVKAVSDATSEEMKALSAEAKKLGASTAWSAKEVTDAEMLLAQAGYSVKETIEALPGLLSLASADQIDLATATDIAAGTMQAFGLAASQSAHVADVLALSASSTNSDVAGLGEAMKYVAPVSKALGIDVEQTAAAIGLLSNANIKASQAGTVLRAGLSRLASPTGESAKVINKLRIAAFDAQGTMLPLDQLIGNLRKSTEKLTDQQRADAISTIFGVEAMSGFLALMEQGPDKLRELTNELYKSEGAAKKMADTRLDSLTGSFVIMKSAIEGAKIQLGEKFAPTVRSVADRISNELPKAMEKFEKTYNGMVNSSDWVNADWVDRIKIAWDQIISKPFAAWWQTQGKAEFERVSGEMGKTILRATGGAVKEAFSFNGTSSLLAAGALAIPGVKIGKGVVGTIKSLKSVGQAGTGAASGMGLAARSAGMLGPSIGALANPIGLTLAGVGALGLGWVTYRKYQEKARQELLNMKGALDKVFSDYSGIKTRTEQTKKLTQEYDDLSRKISDTATPAEQLEEARRRLKEVEQELINLNPEILKAEDAKSDRFRKQLGYANELNDIKTQMGKRDLEKSVNDQTAKLPELKKEYQRLTENLKTYDKAYVDAQKAYVQYAGYVNRQQAIEQSSSSEEEKARSLYILAKEIEEVTGKLYSSNWGNLGLAMQEFNDKNNTAHENWKKTQEDILKADSSFEAMYQDQKKLIELNLGGTIEDTAKKFQFLSESGKTKFNEALEQLAQLNKQMNLLPTDKKINVKVFYEQTGQQMPTSQMTVQDMTAKDLLKQSPGFSSFTLPKFGDGGFSRTPSIFGEAGLEAAIPIDNRPRSHVILDRVNQMMGHDTGERATIRFNDILERSNRLMEHVSSNAFNITYSPVNHFNVANGADVRQQVLQAEQESRINFERWFRDMMRNEKRLSFS